MYRRSIIPCYKISRILWYFMLLAFIGCTGPNLEVPRAIAIEEYNLKIAAGYKKKESWVQSPLLIALELVGTNTVVEKRKILMQRLNKGEMITKAKITIEDSGMFDDSKRNAKYVFVLELIHNQWRVLN